MPADFPTAAESAVQHPDAQIIFLRLRVPDTLRLGFLFPPRNIIGTLLLREALRLALENRGALVTCTLVGELNDAWGLMRVSHRPGGLAAIHELLKATNLAPFATLAWLDTAEIVFRAVHRGSFAPPLPESLADGGLERLWEAHAREHRRLLAEIAAWRNQAAGS
jgi:hypothetical protein